MTKTDVHLCIFRNKIYALLVSYGWASPCARVSRGYLHMNDARAARVRYRIRDNELDGKDLTSCWFHTDYLITEYLFLIVFTSFKSRHVKLSIDITPMSVFQN